jgi:hypothetical protein
LQGSNFDDRLVNWLDPVVNDTKTDYPHT